MTDTPTDGQPQPRRRLIAAALSGGGLVSGGIGFGIATWLNTTHPTAWTASGWAAIGTWFAGAATFGAVLVALQQGRHARNAAAAAEASLERRHREQLWEAAFPADRDTISPVLDRLRTFNAELSEMDLFFYDFRGMLVQLQNQPDLIRTVGTKSTWDDRVDKLKETYSTAIDIVALVQDVRSQIRTPEMEAALRTAESEIREAADTLYPIYIRAQRIATPERVRIIPETGTGDRGEDYLRVFHLLTPPIGIRGHVRHAEQTIRDAIGAARTRSFVVPADPQ